MPKKRNNRIGNETAELLKDMMIIQLGLAGVKQGAIRQVIGCNINRVNAIVKHLKKASAKMTG